MAKKNTVKSIYQEIFAGFNWREVGEGGLRLDYGELAGPIRDLGIDPTSREGRNLRQRLDRLRMGSTPTKPSDVLAFLCLKEVATGRLDPERYSGFLDEIVPDATDYKQDHPETRWALMYALWRMDRARGE